MCSVLVNKLRPSRTVAEAIPNAAANQRLENLVATRHAVITRLGKMYDTIYFTSPSFPGVEISAARRYVIVMVPGHVDAMWPHFAPAVRASIVPNLLPIIAATQTIIGDEIFFARIAPRISLASELKDLRSTTTTTQLPKMSRGSLTCRQQ